MSEDARPDDASADETARPEALRPEAPPAEAPPAEAPPAEAPQAEAPQAEAAQAEVTHRRRHLRAGVLIGVLTAILGFAIAAQVRSTSSSDSLQNLREDDLIRILDDQNARAERLNQQIADLQNTLDELRRSGNSNAVAKEQAQRELESLQVLLGTMAATGPGISVELTDPKHKLKAEDLLDVVEELRGAGAESIQFGPVRVTTSTSFVDGSDGLRVDDQVLGPPYEVLAIGDPTTLDTALNIPGGVAATARNAGGDARIAEQQQLTITARSTVPSPKYAAPAGR
jgi:uncharacterized protein YlxW (UPF0749 family)